MSDKMKKNKKLWIDLLCIFACLFLSSCNDNRKIDRTSNNNKEEVIEPSVSTSTDPTVIEKIFPSLEGTEEIEMEQLKYGGSETRESIPGPVDYKYRGYITLSPEAAEKYAETYRFSEMNAQVAFYAIMEREGHWAYSFDFCKAMIPAGYSGYIWMSDNILLFDIGTM